MSNWTAEETYELIVTWVKYHKFGNLTINFKGGEIPNITKNESIKPSKKAESLQEVTNGNTSS
jgi:hypothetical protein